ncbi:MAG TPA: urea amidolyase associated protein UAAP1 [Candidatus Sulfotelmatobacter sp.]|nr:urea amidolyase associated protein UAAP1 [Candidatus Sulfotelmatobacter sp.]
MSESPILWEETIQPGATWSHVLKRGTALRIVDLEGGANVGAIFYNFECPTERYNMPDTLKAQHIARLTTGFVLYSDMGRILCSVIADTVGWHDPLGGTSNKQLVEKKYGPSTYQESRNDYHKNGRDSFLIELGKWGLGPRDLVPNVNFFSRVDVADAGGMTFTPGNFKAGNFIELRAEMNVLAILNTCQHPLDPNPKYQPKPVQVAICRVASPAVDDPCRISRPENGRGFTLTERYFL